MISQTSDYALRAVACLARRPGESMTTQQIAVASRVPAGYLAKILQALARAGIVSGQRGLGGGFVLARRPDQLTLLDVVQVADGSRRITACPLGIPGHGPELCPLHRRLDDAVALAEKTLSGVTVADVLSEPLCGARAAPGSPCLTNAFPPSPGTPGEGRGEGLLLKSQISDFKSGPHPDSTELAQVPARKDVDRSPVTDASAKSA